MNGRVPLLKQACASWILNRTVGPFRLVLAFGDNQKDKGDVPAVLVRAQVSSPGLTYR